MITISAFKSVPAFAQGRHLRARWALEEAGLPYRARLIDADDQASASYRALQPSGQVPIFEEDGLVLFESGSIVLHIGERSGMLLPSDEAARARDHLARRLRAIWFPISAYKTSVRIGWPVAKRSRSRHCSKD